MTASMATVMATVVAPSRAEPAPQQAPGRAPADPLPTWPIEALWAADPAPPGVPTRGAELPDELRARFAAPLAIPLHPDRPTIVANFVSTLDGVVALDRIGATGGREISGGFEPDRFVMGLLRATADAVVVGTGTVRASGSRDWTPGAAHPPSAAGYARWRRDLGLSAVPATIVVSGSGRVDLGGLGPAHPDGSVMLVTTTAGARRLRGQWLPEGVEIVAVADGPRIPVTVLCDVLHARGYRVVLSEAGPTLFGELLAAGAVDEVFLTVAPQLAGRSESAHRLGLVEGVGFPRDVAPWARLRSVMRSADHLFLRYELTGPTAASR